MGQRKPRAPHRSKGLAVIRTSAVCARFLGFACPVAEPQQTVERSQVLRCSGDFYLLLMDQAEIDNWKTIAESMEAKGIIESWFYLRARAIADGKPDPYAQRVRTHGRQ